MPNNLSKKQIILDLSREQGLQRVRENDMRRIQAGVRLRLANNGGASLSYIATVLREAGIPVDYRDRFSDPAMEEPYASRLKGVLQFADLVSAETSLHTLYNIFREYREASDREGTSLVRSVVVKGKERAASLARNPRISPQKRQEKQEIAQWFHVWLETTDLFFDWLELRKQSEEFQNRFTNHRERTSTNTPSRKC
ncbi:MAG: DUF4385 family protein [Acidobacteria bacterium]|nr:DUF4385 family protein [Acidobacteriota bacterium]